MKRPSMSHMALFLLLVQAFFMAMLAQGLLLLPWSIFFVDSFKSVYADETTWVSILIDTWIYIGAFKVCVIVNYHRKVGSGGSTSIWRMVLLSYVAPVMRLRINHGLFFILRH